MARLRLDELEADRARLRAFAAHAVAERLFGILRHQGLQLGLRPFMRKKALPVLQKIVANSAQELEPVMSTTRTAAMRGLGGSIPNKRGGFPLSTQRQNFFSAVSKRFW